MLDRAERREEIKMILEYVRLFVSFVGLSAIVFAGLQWRGSTQAAQEANKAADFATYVRITGEWREHLRLFTEKPNIRPYFQARRELPADEDQKNMILAIADVRLDTMDAILTYAHLRGKYGDIKGWHVTFQALFQNSSVLCDRLRETWAIYGLVRQMAPQCAPGRSSN